MLPTRWTVPRPRLHRDGERRIRPAERRYVQLSGRRGEAGRLCRERPAAGFQADDRKAPLVVGRRGEAAGRCRRIFRRDGGAFDRISRFVLDDAADAAGLGRSAACQSHDAQRGQHTFDQMKTLTHARPCCSVYIEFRETSSRRCSRPLAAAHLAAQTPAPACNLPPASRLAPLVAAAIARHANPAPWSHRPRRRLFITGLSAGPCCRRPSDDRGHHLRSRLAPKVVATTTSVMTVEEGASA